MRPIYLGVRVLAAALKRFIRRQAPRPGGNINAVGRPKKLKGEWNGRKRSADPALNEEHRASSYTFSAAALEHAAHDAGPLELLGATAGGHSVYIPGWSLPFVTVIRRR